MASILDSTSRFTFRNLIIPIVSKILLCRVVIVTVNDLLKWPIASRQLAVNYEVLEIVRCLTVTTSSSCISIASKLLSPEEVGPGQRWIFIFGGVIVNAAFSFLIPPYYSLHDGDTDSYTSFSYLRSALY